MRTRIAHSVLLILALSGTAHASTENHTQETLKARQDKAVGIGLGTGVLVGAVIGGPIGAAAAGMFGAVMGDNIVKTDALEDTQQTLAKTQSDLTFSEQALLSADASIEKMQNKQRVWQNIQSAIQFKTGSDELEVAYEAQLNRIAKVLEEHPDLFLELTGYADRRGDETFNLALSNQRANSVKAYLIEKGVDSKQLLTSAMGEMDRDNDTLSREMLFFDRKVVMTLRGEQDALTAAQ